MSRFNTGSTSNYLQLNSAIVTAAPLTLVGWLWPTSATGAYTIIDIAHPTDGNGGNFFSLSTSEVTAGRIAANTANHTTEGTAETTIGMTANQWNHCAAVIASSTSRAAFLNGSNKGTNTTNLSPTGLARTNIGLFRNSLGNFGPLNGKVAEVAIWNVALSDGEIVQLANGCKPYEIRPSALLGYWLPFDDSGVGTVYDCNPFRPRENDMVLSGTMPLDIHPPKVAQYHNKTRKYGLYSTGTISGGTTFTLTAAEGTYALTGEAANLLRALDLASAQGTYSLTGENALLDIVYILTATEGVYNITGESANLLKGFDLLSTQGIYTLTGENANLTTIRDIVADKGTYSLTGETANLLYEYLSPEQQGTYTLLGENAGLLVQHFGISAQGTYSLTGESANLLRNYDILIVQGVYDITGESANLLHSILEPATQGTYTLTGRPANLIGPGTNPSESNLTTLFT